MAKQIHFVVFYDTETKQFEIDYDTLDAKFDEAYVFDTDKQKWEDVGDSEGTRDVMYQSGDALAEALLKIKI